MFVRKRNIVGHSSWNLQGKAWGARKEDKSNDEKVNMRVCFGAGLSWTSLQHMHESLLGHPLSWTALVMST